MTDLQTLKEGLPDDWKFLENVFSILQEGEALDNSSNDKVVDFYQPNDLKKIIDLDIPNEHGVSRDKLKEICRQVVHYSVKTNHPYFRNQLFGQMDPFGLAGAWISEALNTSAYTFEVAPVFSLVETEIIKKVCQLIGYTNGDGIFSPGGSISNMYGLVLARYKAIPDVKTKGLSGIPPLVVFTSEESHYSIKKASHWLGIGTDNHVEIKTNGNGQMLVTDLEEKILKAKSEGKIPLMVNATAGTTVLGAFDNFREISKICKKYSIWLHVDACNGGGIILSKDNKHLFDGIEETDSLAWDPHKALGVPLQCAIFVCKENNILAQCNSTDAKYLFQQDKYYDVSYDTGNKSIQCGRKIDAFKLWLMFKARGLSNFGLLVDNTIAIGKMFAKKLEKREGFTLVLNEFQFSNICFWYIPKKMRNQEKTPEWYNKLYQVAPKIKEKMVKSGSLMVGYSPLSYRNLGNFFRMIFTCFPVFVESELDDIINEIESLGESIVI